MNRKLAKFTVLAVILATVFQATPTFASPSDPAITQEQIDATQEQINNFETELQQLDNRIIEALEKSENLNEKIKTQEGRIIETKADIEKAKKDLYVHQNILSERLRSIQLDGNQSISTYAEVLLSSKNIAEFFSRFTAITQIVQSDTDLVNGLNEKQQVLVKAEEKIQREYEQLKKSKEELASEQRRIEENKKKVAKTLVDVKNKLQNQQEQLARQEAERQAQLLLEAEERQNQTEPQTQQQSAENKVSESTPTPVTNTANLTNSETVNKVIANAKQYLGVPYVWGGASPSGFDCSGLVQYVYRSVGVSLPRVSRDQQNVGTKISLSQVQPGDLVFRGSPAYHVGIYIGGGQYIHAPQTGDVVKISPYNPSKFTSAARVF